MTQVDIHEGMYEAVVKYVNEDRIRWRSIRQFVNEAVREKLDNLGVKYDKEG